MTPHLVSRWLWQYKYVLNVVARVWVLWEVEYMVKTLLHPGQYERSRWTKPSHLWRMKYINASREKDVGWHLFDGSKKHFFRRYFAIAWGVSEGGANGACPSSFRTDWVTHVTCCKVDITVRSDRSRSDTVVSSRDILGYTGLWHTSLMGVWHSREH